MFKLLASLGHTGRRRVVLGHTLNTLQHVITQKKSRNVFSKFTILCWTTSTTVLGRMRPVGPQVRHPWFRGLKWQCVNQQSEESATVVTPLLCWQTVGYPQKPLGWCPTAFCAVQLGEHGSSIEDLISSSLASWAFFTPPPNYSSCKVNLGGEFGNCSFAVFPHHHNLHLNVL